MKNKKWIWKKSKKKIRKIDKKYKKRITEASLQTKV